LKKYIKYFFYVFGLSPLWDRFIFRFAQIRFRKKNQTYRNNHPDILLPDDYDLHETFRLDYQKYMVEGKLAAAEICEDSTRIAKKNFNGNLLDWGCGTGRITRHLPKVFPNARVFGCDTHDRRMEWNRNHAMGIHFTKIEPLPPTPYANEFFELIIGFSVLTHIDADSQDAWLAELYRILKPGGILWLTTQGEAYCNQLLGFEKRKLYTEGIYTRKAHLPGHRMMSTYHFADNFREKLSRYFSIREYYAGKSYPAKTGGQDLWILQK
jgi:SAM-dependent methyltransferase